MNGNDLPLMLLADIREIIGSLVGLVLLLLWVIGQLSEGKKKQANRPAAQRAAVPQPEPQEAVAAQGGGKPPLGREMQAERQPAGGLRGEMEEFLRRAAAQKRGGQAQAGKRPAAVGAKPRPPRVDKIEVLVDEQGRVAEGRRMGDPMRPKQQRPPAAPRPAPTSGAAAGGARRRAAAKHESVADHVLHGVGVSTSAMASHASALGQRIVQEDAEFDVQLKAKFDHEVGTLASVVRVTDTPSQSPDHRDAITPAARLAAMLASPEGVRQAIIMNEVLRRPSERW